jgi:hypothetical protein
MDVAAGGGGGGGWEGGGGGGSGSDNLICSPRHCTSVPGAGGGGGAGSSYFASGTGPGTITTAQPGAVPFVTVTFRLPAISSVSPTTLATGASWVPMQINGINFQPPATVIFTGPGKGLVGRVSAATSTQVKLSAYVSESATPGQYTVWVKGADGNLGKCVGCLTVTGGPKITSVSPTALTRDPSKSVTVTVTGSGFSRDAQLVGPRGVVFSIPSVSADGTSISASAQVSKTALTGANLPIKVKNGPLGGYGTGTANVLTIS